MKKLGKFEIIDKIGQGAMGVVYKARDPFIDRTVALKTLTTGLSEDPNLLRRFYTEARAAGNLQHPNIVTIFELGHEGDTPFIAMQFLNGESLDKIIERRPKLPLSQKIGFIVYVCRALEYAHKQTPPVVHRDIKPGNVMVTTEGSVIVVDFGIARLGEGTQSQSAGLLIGTLGYMSPQLFRNSSADARSDIWATGVMFYELLVGRRPFEGDNAAALMSNIILEQPRPLSEAAPGTPEDLHAVVNRMLAKEISARYQSMEEVLLELEPIWRRIQQSEVSELLANSQRLFEAGDLGSAKAQVSQILHIDTANTVAKSLLERINAEVRRTQLAPQLKARVEKAQQLLAEGQAEAARAEVKAALDLDSTFHPARELSAKVEAVLERGRSLAQALRSSKQFLAEGALTEAEGQLDKALEIDPGSTAARDQLKQLRDERARRERKKQRDEVLHRARAHWTNLEYQECIDLLVGAEKQFPADTEIAKLLQSARQDQSEQSRLLLLNQIRSLLNNQQFDESQRKLAKFLEQYPGDATAENLRTLALQGAEQRKHEERLEREKARLRLLVKEGKYLEVIAQAGQLSKEFTEDFELSEMLDFARTEQSQLEQKRRLEEYSKKIQQAVKAGHFPEAILAAEKALLEFPKNVDLLILLDRAKKEQAEKERHETLKKRLREVEGLMERQKLTDAIDLARQTIATVGHDPRIADTLLKAEREFEFRENRKRQQNETVQMAQTLLDAGKFGDATSILKGALDTQLFSSDDPRVTQLLNEIDSRKLPPTPPTPPAAAPSAPPFAQSTSPRLGSPITSTPSADPGRDYVYQRGAPLEQPPASPETVAFAASPTIIAGPSQQPSAPPQPTIIPTPPPKVKKGAPRPELTPAPADVSATQLLPAGTKIAESPAQIFAPAPEVTEGAVPQPTALPFWKNKVVLGGIAAALVVAVGVTIYALRPKPTGTRQGETVSSPQPGTPTQLTAAPGVPESAPPTAAPGAVGKPAASAQARYNQGESFAQRGDWSRAKSAFQDVAQAPDADASLRSKASQRVSDAQNHLDELSRLKSANDALNRGDKGQAKTLLQQVVDMRLDHAVEARELIKGIDAGNTANLLRAQIGSSVQQRDFSAARQHLREFVSQGGHDANGDLARQIDGAETQWFNDLQRQFDQAKGASDANQLNGLREDLQKIAHSGGPSSARAQSLLDSAIPNAVSEINARNAWMQFKSECDAAVGRNDTGAMQALKNRVAPYMSGPYAGEAKNCNDRITAALTPAAPPKATPPPAASNPPVATPPVDPKPAIRVALDDLNRAFSTRRIEEVRKVWTSMPKKQADTLKSSFDAAKLQVTFTATDINVTGDTAAASGSWAGTYQAGKTSGQFRATLRRQGDRWVISDLTM